MKILFKVFRQTSHLNATFLLARGLQAMGHEVVYAGVDSIRGYVKLQGFGFYVQAEDFIPYREPKRGDPKLTLAFAVTQSWKNRKWARALRLRHERKAAFDELVTAVEPDLVLVDSPYSYFALSLFRLGVPFGMLESMTNLNRSSGCPPLDTAYCPGFGMVSRLRERVLWARYFAKRKLLGLLGFRVDFNRRFVERMMRISGVQRADIAFDRYFHLGLRRVPEFILSPRGFDFPREAVSNQVYVGPAVRMDRVESASDFGFSRKFERLKRFQRNGRKLVYASLGTASWRYPGVERFLGRLIEAARGKPWCLLVATGTEVALPADLDIPENVEVLQVVPQLTVLRNADAMVTHGGMNSITECILSGVPMVVFPGTTQIDQAGNAARVVFHRLGLKGVMKKTSSTEIGYKIKRVLSEPAYRESVLAMGDRIRGSDAYRNGASLVLSAIRKYFPGSVAGGDAGAHGGPDGDSGVNDSVPLAKQL